MARLRLGIAVLGLLCIACSLALGLHGVQPRVDSPANIAVFSSGSMCGSVLRPSAVSPATAGGLHGTMQSCRDARRTDFYGTVGLFVVGVGLVSVAILMRGRRTPTVRRLQITS